jgi:DNA segregation ATPase FtsK/SpoIIIE, S-DNA-T family
MRGPQAAAGSPAERESEVIADLRPEPSAPAAAALVEEDDPVWMSQPDRRSVVEIHAVSGPGAGRVWPLGTGVHDIGSAPGSTIQLTGDGVPERGIQVKVRPSGQVSLVPPDDAKDVSRLIRVNVINPPGDRATPRRATGEIPWPADGDLVLGEMVLQVTLPSAADAAVTRSPDGLGLDYIRAHREVPQIPAGRFRSPRPPPIPRSNPIPVPMVIAVVLLGIGLAWVLRSFFLFVFVLFGSGFTVINRISQRCNARRAFWRDLKRFWDGRVASHDAIRQAIADERKLRCDTLMDPARAALTAIGPGRRLWERRRGDADYLVLRLGTLNQPSMIEIEDPVLEDPGRISRWELPNVPFALDLAARGVLGLAGEAAATRAIAAWLVIQAAVLHSPRQLKICLLTDGPGQAVWDWVRLLPHAQLASGRHGPVVLVGNGDESTGTCIGELVSVVRARGKAATGAIPPMLFGEPDFMIVADGARRFLGIDGMAQILTEGPALRVFSICLDEREQLLPRECTGVVWCDPAALTIRQQDLPDFTGIRPDLVTPAWCDRVARPLAALRDVTPD